MRRTFVNIAKQLNEKKARQRKSSDQKEAIAGHAKRGLKAFAAVAALLALAAAAYFHWNGSSTPEAARVADAHPADAEKALALAKKALSSFKESPADFEKLCSGMDKMGFSEIKKTLSRLTAPPLFEKAAVKSPTLGGGVFYVKVPLDGGGCLNMSMRYCGNAMSLINISPN